MQVNAAPRAKTWHLVAVLVALFLVNLIPPYAERPYAPEDTQSVVIELLMVSVTPFERLAVVLHLATLLIVALIALNRGRMGQVLAGYMGLNYLLIGAIQSMGRTASYGFVVHSGELATCAVLGLSWLTVASRNGLQASFKGVPAWRWALLPLALLAFWSPADALGRPDLSPLLLLTSPGYGLTLCFTTPVFLFLLILLHPNVSRIAFLATAFTGLLYGLLNMTHFAFPERRWMGVLHLPLLVLATVALVLAVIERRSLAASR